MNKRSKRLTVAIIAILSVNSLISYLLIQNQETFLLQSVLAASIISTLISLLLFPKKEPVLLPLKIITLRSLFMLVIFFVITFICIGSSLVGKKYQQRHHPNTYIPL